MSVDEPYALKSALGSGYGSLLTIKVQPVIVTSVATFALLLCYHNAHSDKVQAGK